MNAIPESELLLSDTLRQHPLWELFRTPEISWPYLAGLWDADGSIYISLPKSGTLARTAVLAQSNLAILSAVHHFLAGQGIIVTLILCNASKSAGAGRQSYGSRVYELRVSHLLPQQHTCNGLGSSFM